MNQQRSRALRILACAVVLTLCFILESSLSLKISVFGAHFDFLPPIIASAAVCLGCPAGMVCGLLAGILYDASGMPVEGLLPIYYMVWGIIGGFVGERYRRRPMRCVLALSIGMTIVLSLIRCLFYFQFITTLAPLMFVKSVLTHTVMTAVLCPIVFVVIRRIAGKHPQRMKKTPRRVRREDGNG